MQSNTSRVWFYESASERKDNDSAKCKTTFGAYNQVGWNTPITNRDTSNYNPARYSRFLDANAVNCTGGGH